MPKKRDKYHRYLDDESHIQTETDTDEEDFTEEELEELYAMMEDFHELNGLDNILDYDDEDFYKGEA